MLKLKDLKKLIAEATGTFALTLIILLSFSNLFDIPTPILAALTVGLFVYFIGEISGAHINPAVTIGFLSLRKISLVDAIKYIVAQAAGALLALGLLLSLGANFQGLSGLNQWWVALGEGVGAAIFTFGVAAVALGKVEKIAGGAIIGASFLLGVSFAALLGGPGFLNPAVALGAKSLSVTTLAAPIVGGLVGMLFYRFLSK